MTTEQQQIRNLKWRLADLDEGSEALTDAIKELQEYDPDWFQSKEMRNAIFAMQGYVSRVKELNHEQ